MGGMGTEQTTRTSKECIEAAKVLVSEAERLKEKEAVEHKEASEQIVDTLLEARVSLFGAAGLASGVHCSERLLAISQAICKLDDALI